MREAAHLLHTHRGPDHPGEERRNLPAQQHPARLRTLQLRPQQKGPLVKFDYRAAAVFIALIVMLAIIIALLVFVVPAWIEAGLL